MQQAPQDSIIFSGFLNHFKWNESGKSAFIFLSVSDQDAQGQTVYRSVPVTVTSKLANMLYEKYKEIQTAKQQQQKHPVLLQIYSGKVSSYSAKNTDGSEGLPVPTITGFRGRVLSMDSNRTILDDSENPNYAHAPQQQAPAPQQQAPAPQYAPQQPAPAPQYAPQQQAAAPQQQAFSPPEEPKIDFDDDIPF